MVPVPVLTEPPGLVRRWELREDGGFGEEVSSGDELTMYLRSLASGGRVTEGNTTSQHWNIAWEVGGGVGGWDGLGGALGTWARGFLSQQRHHY